MFIPEWLKGLRFAFSRPGDGQMSFNRADPTTVRDNRWQFLSELGLDLNSVVAGELTHSAEVTVVAADDAGRGASSPDWIPEVDGLVTSDPGLLLLTTHADCAPLIIYDPVHKVIGQAHAGWRGLASGLVEALVRTVGSLNGSDPGALKAWIGPTIRSCCYPVGPDVASRFPPECIILAGDSVRLDLARFIQFELQRLGFNPEELTDSGICTGCDKGFSSFRREGYQTQAMACVTGLTG